MIWGGRWEGGSCLGTHVHPWWSPGSFKWREHLNPHLGIQCVCVCVCVCMCVLLSRGWLFATPWTSAYQVPLSINSPGKNTGVGCYSLLQGFSVVTGNLKYTHARALPHKSSGREFKIQRTREGRYFGSWSSLGFA